MSVLRPRSRDIFGAENFYVEVMDHGTTSSDAPTSRSSRRCLRPSWPPTTRTTSSATTARSRTRPVHQPGSRINDPDRFKFDGDGY